jgi:hypothetical protein
VLKHTFTSLSLLPLTFTCSLSILQDGLAASGAGIALHFLPNSTALLDQMELRGNEASVSEEEALSRPSVVCLMPV